MKKQHVIGKTTMELSLKGRVGEPFQLQDKANKFCKEKLLPALEEMFDNLVEDGVHIVIQKLTVDVSGIEGENWEEQALGRILAQIKEQIEIGFYTPNSEQRLTKKPAALGHFDRWVWYLENGNFPFYTAAIEEAEMLRHVLETVASQAFAVNRLRQMMKVSKQVVQRIVVQHPIAFVKNLAAAVSGRNMDSLEAFIQEMSEVLSGFSSSKSYSKGLRFNIGSKLFGDKSAQKQVWIELIWETLFRESIAKEKHLDQGDLVIRFFQESFNKDELDILTKHLQKLLTRKNKGQAINKMAALLDISLQGQSAFMRVGDENPREIPQPVPKVPSLILSGKTKTDLLENEGNEKAGEIPQPLPIDDDFINSAENKSELPAKEGNAPIQMQEKIGSGPPSTSSDFEDAKPQLMAKETEQARRSGANEAVPFRIPNNGDYWYMPLTGLILLHPFFSTLFKSVKLLNEENQFLDEIQKERAVHLLGYIATGKQSLHESELMFPKFLCGFNLETPLRRAIQLSEEEKAEADQLLLAAIRHWNKLGTTSLETLRGGFLVRNGKLSYTSDNGWMLQVEQHTLDVLLNFLPWGIGIVRYPWMPAMLRVEWTA